MIVVRKKTDTGWWQGEMSATGTVSVKMTEFYENSVKSFHDGGDGNDDGDVSFHYMFSFCNRNFVKIKYMDI